MKRDCTNCAKLKHNECFAEECVAGGYKYWEPNISKVSPTITTEDIPLLPCYLPKTNKDLELIDKSIDKWKDIVYNGGIDMGVEDCALCGEYLYKKSSNMGYSDGGRSCNNCPILIYTGESFCVNTPYADYRIVRGDVAYRKTERKRSDNLMLSFMYELRLWQVNKINSRPSILV